MLFLHLYATNSKVSCTCKSFLTFSWTDSNHEMVLYFLTFLSPGITNLLINTSKHFGHLSACLSKGTHKSRNPIRQSRPALRRSAEASLLTWLTKSAALLCFSSERFTLLFFVCNELRQATNKREINESFSSKEAEHLACSNGILQREMENQNLCPCFHPSTTSIRGSPVVAFTPWEISPSVAVGDNTPSRRVLEGLWENGGGTAAPPQRGADRPARPPLP